MTPAEQKIVDLSAKVITLQDTPEFHAAVQALKDAIRQHLSEARDKVADFALVVAAIEEAKEGAKAAY